MVKRSVKLKSGSNKFKNYFKQLAVPFKIYADFESVLKEVHSNDNDNNASYTKEYQKQIPCSFAQKFVCTDDRFSKKIVLYRGKDAVNKFVEAILKENEYCRKMIKKHSDKNLFLSVEDERSFKSSNKCWIYNKLFAAKVNKVRDHDQVTGKYRGSRCFHMNIWTVLKSFFDDKLPDRCEFFSSLKLY